MRTNTLSWSTPVSYPVAPPLGVHWCPVLLQRELTQLTIEADSDEDEDDSVPLTATARRGQAAVASPSRPAQTPTRGSAQHNGGVGGYDDGGRYGPASSRSARPPPLPLRALEVDIQDDEHARKPPSPRWGCWGLLRGGGGGVRGDLNMFSLIHRVAASWPFHGRAAYCAATCIPSSLLPYLGR